MSREEEPPRRRREIKAIVVTIVIVLVFVAIYFAVEGFGTAPLDAPDSEPPGTTAPSFTEPTEPMTGG